MDTPMNRRRGLLAASALALVGAGVGAQQPASVLRAHVIDSTTGTPISGVEIFVIGVGRTARTDSIGAAIIDRLSVGRASVEARRVGFAPRVAEVALRSDDTTDVVLALRPASQTLPLVKTVDSSDSHGIPEFEERLKSHIGGFFVTEDEIRKNQSSTLANLLRTKVPGIEPVVNPDRTTTIYSRRSVEHCIVLTFIDGVRFLERNLDILGPETLGGIEYYPPGFVPPKYRLSPAYEPPDPVTKKKVPGPRAECGVLLLWTRR